MKITIIGVGKLKEKYLKQGIAEYAKRLSKYTKFEIIEVADEQAPENLSQAQMQQVKEKEGQRILAKIKETDYVYALAIQGKLLSSEDLASSMEQATIRGKSHLVFVIGGSLGLAEDVLKRSDEQLSFGRITLPHQLMRLVLSEQVYRGFRIINNHAYHK